jgi:hypothetical protein
MQPGFGVLLEMILFLVAGSRRTPLFWVYLCDRCQQRGNLLKALEWISRAAGILILIVLLVTNTSPQLPLIRRGIGTILLVISPVIIGVLLAWFFRNQADQMKGVSFQKTDGRTDHFLAQSEAWLREYNHRQEAAFNEEKMLENDPRVVRFYQTTLETWAHGDLTSLSSTYKTVADRLDLAGMIQRYPPYEGRSLRVFFQQFPPKDNEYLVNLGEGHWYVLTNLRLVQKDGRTHEYREVTLLDIAKYEIGQQKLATLTFTLKSGQTIQFFDTGSYPLHKVLTGLISLTIMAERMSQV